MASNYDLTSPCKDCPFLASNIEKFDFSYDRAHELADVAYNSTFDCHKTVDFREDEDGEPYQALRPGSQVCAGSLIALEKQDTPSQMMRIAERIGVYDRTKLNMDADVPEMEEWIDSHG